MRCLLRGVGSTEIEHSRGEPDEVTVRIHNNSHAISHPRHVFLVFPHSRVSEAGRDTQLDVGVWWTSAQESIPRGSFECKLCISFCTQNLKISCNDSAGINIEGRFQSLKPQRDALHAMPRKMYQSKHFETSW